MESSFTLKVSGREVNKASRAEKKTAVKEELHKRNQSNNQYQINLTNKLQMTEMSATDGINLQRKSIKINLLTFSFPASD